MAATGHNECHVYTSLARARDEDGTYKSLLSTPGRAALTACPSTLTGATRSQLAPVLWKATFMLPACDVGLA